MSCAFAWLIFALSHTALAGKDYNRLVRLKEGASFTISCNPTEKQESLNLLGRLDKDETQVLHLDLKTRTSKSRLEDRVKYTENGDPYKLLITISNLTVEDTKVYWCEYSRFDPAAGNVLETEGKESVLLVVDATEQCDATEALSLSTYLLFGLASIFSTLLLIGLIVYICPKKKAKRAKKRVSPTRTNDVYEDMRATIRR